MTDTTTLTGATLPDGRVRDVVLRHGSVSHLRPAGPAVPACDHVDLRGYLLLPAPVEPHLHLDRALTWEPTGTDPGGRDGATRSWRAWPARYGVADLRRRAHTALLALSANGVTAVRAHVDVGAGAGSPLRAVEILRDLREDLYRILDLQVVAVPSPGLSDRAALDAFAAGANLLGGRPHLAPDPRIETRRLLRLADRAETDLDVHLDDQPDRRVLAVADLARLLRASGFGRRVTASHCAGLGVLRPPALAKVVEAIAASGMGVVGLPSAADTGALRTSRHLAGARGLPDRRLPARARALVRNARAAADPTCDLRRAGHVPFGGTAPLHALLQAGVPLAAGGDHLRDALHPMGRADAFETAALLAAAGGLTAADAYAAVSTGARAVLGLPAAGPEPGAVADLVAVRAGSLAEALAAPPTDRIVIRHGRVVARATTPRVPAQRARAGVRVPVGAR